MRMVDSVTSPKQKMINVRLSPTVLDQFKIACELRGVSMSSLLHQFIVRTIREERELEPDAFFKVAADDKRQRPDGKSVPIVSSHPIQHVNSSPKKRKKIG